MLRVPALPTPVATPLKALDITLDVGDLASKVVASKEPDEHSVAENNNTVHRELATTWKQPDEDKGGDEFGNVLALLSDIHRREVNALRIELARLSETELVPLDKALYACPSLGVELCPSTQLREQPSPDEGHTEKVNYSADVDCEEANAANYSVNRASTASTSDQGNKRIKPGNVASIAERGVMLEPGSVAPIDDHSLAELSGHVRIKPGSVASNADATLSVLSHGTSKKKPCKISHIGTRMLAIAKSKDFTAQYGRLRKMKPIAIEQAENKNAKEFRSNARPVDLSLEAVQNISKLGGQATEASVGHNMSRIVKHMAFDVICGLAIVLNGLLIGYNTQMASENSPDSWQVHAGYGFSIYFLTELVLRAYVEGRQYWSISWSDRCFWNWFDTVLVLLSLLDFLLVYLVEARESGDELQFRKRMQTIKILRVARVFRVFRFCRELTALMLMIVGTITSLFWALVLVMIIVYVFGIFFTIQARAYLDGPMVASHADSFLLTGLGERQQIDLFFGSLSKTCYILVQSMMGGISWGLVSDAALAVGGVTFILWFFYIGFVLLAVMNIITGVFVDNAVAFAQTRREFLIQQELELREEFNAEMMEFFTSMDEDNSGTISLDEAKALLNDIDASTYFQVLGLNPNDMDRLFRLLDADSSGEVNMEEFLDGCLRLKGGARSIDVHSVMYETKKIRSELAKLMASSAINQVNSCQC